MTLGTLEPRTVHLPSITQGMDYSAPQSSRSIAPAELEPADLGFTLPANFHNTKPSVSKEEKRLESLLGDEGLLALLKKLIEELWGLSASNQSNSSGSSGSSGGGNQGFARPASYSSSGGSSGSYQASNNAPAASNPNRGPLAPADPRSTPKMQELARVAESNARQVGTTGWCLREVNDSLEAAGYNIQRRPSAYMVANDLANNPQFKEVTPPADLSKLPAGAVVVWDRGNTANTQHGHISVALGNGMEASDHVQNQLTNYGTQCRVFYPVG